MLFEMQVDRCNKNAQIYPLWLISEMDTHMLDLIHYHYCYFFLFDFPLFFFCHELIEPNIFIHCKYSWWMKRKMAVSMMEENNFKPFDDYVFFLLFFLVWSCKTTSINTFICCCCCLFEAKKITNQFIRYIIRMYFVVAVFLIVNVLRTSCH